MTIQTWVPNEIAEWEAPVSGATLGIVTEADRSISELNRDAAEFAAIEALSRQLLRQESVASSRIEGLVMGQRRLARASFDTGGDETAKQIVGNIRAMERAIALGSEDRPFTYEDLIAIHTTLLQATRDAHLAGVVREEQNWVGGTGLSPADAEYIPPPPEYVEKLLRDLVEFVNRDDLPSSLQAAAAHAQFETIHPFLDGNGRVGRCLIHVVLRRGRAAKTVVPPISLVLATNADAYIAGLGAWRGESPSEWILFFAGVAITAAREARRLADMVGEMQGAWLDRAGNPRRDSSAHKLIEQLPAEPIISINRAIELTGATRPAVDRAFAQLEQAEILTRLGNSRRNRQWEARAIFDLLDEYERDLATPDGTKRPARPAPEANRPGDADTSQQVQREASISIGRSAFPGSPLERAVAHALAQGEDLRRRRKVSGEQWFVDALIRWAGETDAALETTEAGDLRVRFRKGGVPPPHGLKEYDGYLEDQLAVLREALTILRSD